MAQGMRQRMSLSFPKMSGNDVLKAGAACTAGKAILPGGENRQCDTHTDRQTYIGTDLYSLYQ